jgi:hypothetical protein
MTSAQYPLLSLQGCGMEGIKSSTPVYSVSGGDSCDSTKRLEVLFAIDWAKFAVSILMTPRQTFLKVVSVIRQYDMMKTKFSHKEHHMPRAEELIIWKLKRL